MKSPVHQYLLVLALLGMVTGCHRQRGYPRVNAGPTAWSTAQQADRGSYHDASRPPVRSISTIGEQAVAFAQAQRGKPYCWGGAGPKCFDCSGLTYRAWRAVGQAIPRTSTAQHERLTRVSMMSVRPGDILWRPGHVGMYVGNGWAIHAPGTGKKIRYQAANKFKQAVRP